MSELRYNVLAIFGAAIMFAYGALGMLGGASARLYESALLSVGLVVAVALTFHLGMLWERWGGESRLH